MLLVSSGSPESRTQRHPVISRVRATGPRLPCANVVVRQVGMAGLEPAVSCSQSTRVRRYPTSRHSVRTGGIEPPISWPPARCDNQASLRSALSDPYESRTRLPALKGRCPQTDRRTGHLAHIFHAVDALGLRAPFTQWVGRCSNPRLLVFSQRYTISATDPTKKARCRYDTGLSVFFRNMSGQVSHAQWITGERIRRVIRRTVLSLSIVV